MGASTSSPSGSGRLDGLPLAAAQTDHHSYFEKINNIYGLLPDTSCHRQGHCCSLLPPLAPVEMLAWLAHQASRPGPERGSEASRLVEHFLLNASLRRPCPWSLPRTCAIYPRRFLACRSYGLWSQGAYEDRREAARAAQGQAEAAWRALGVELSPAVLAPGPEYCPHVRPLCDGEKYPITDADLEDAEERLAGLSRGLPGEDDLLACGGDLSYLLARLTLGERQSLSAKVEVTRAIYEGQTERAASILIKNMKTAYNASTSWTV